MRSFCSAVTRAKTRTSSMQAQRSSSRHLLELRAGQRDRALVPEAQLLGDGDGRQLVVAGDHHRAHVRLGASRDRFTHALARRIDHPDQAEERQAVLDVDARASGERRRPAESIGSACRDRASRRRAREAPCCSCARPRPRIARRVSASSARAPAVGLVVGAERQQHVGASLRVGDLVARSRRAPRSSSACGRRRRAAP